jgi:hypothetical protein
MNYFVISTSEDGDVSLQSMTADQLEERLSEGYWGSRKILNDVALDLQQQAGIRIIKGEFVNPQPVEIVKSWKV